MQTPNWTLYITPKFSVHCYLFSSLRGKILHKWVLFSYLYLLVLLFCNDLEVKLCVEWLFTYFFLPAVGFCVTLRLTIFHQCVWLFLTITIIYLEVGANLCKVHIFLHLYNFSLPFVLLICISVCLRSSLINSLRWQGILWNLFFAA